MKIGTAEVRLQHQFPPAVTVEVEPDSMEQGQTVSITPSPSVKDSLSAFAQSEYIVETVKNAHFSSV